MRVEVGSTIWCYHDGDDYDEGLVSRITEQQVEVDFCDWIEVWASVAAFVAHDLWCDGRLVFVPQCEGAITVDYSLVNATKLANKGDCW